MPKTKQRTIQIDDALRMMRKMQSGGGGGTIVEETDPTVPSWAKQPTKPTYTAAEVGALPNTTKIPTKTSDLTNDSGFLTQHQSLSGYAKTADHYTKTESDNKYQPKGSYLTSVPSEYVTETELAAKKYLTAVPSEYVTESELTAKKYLTSVPSEYVTDSELTAKGYAKQSEVDGLSEEIANLGGGKIVTQDDIHWHQGWEAPNKVSDTDDLAGCTLNLTTNNANRISMTPLWIPEGTVLTRNDDYYMAIDADGVDDDGNPVKIIVSLYEPENANANPNGWVKLLYAPMESTPSIKIQKSGWYVLSTIHGTRTKDNTLFGQPYTFSYSIGNDIEPNYVLTIDWGTYYTVRENKNQPAFSNGLNWVCRREPNCPYYLNNNGTGSDMDKGRYQTSDLTLTTKSSSAVAGIISYKDEIWFFYTSADDNTTLGAVTKLKIYDNHWIEYLGTCYVNAGHINSVSYNEETDTLVWGNGSTSYTLEGKAFIINNFSESKLANSYHEEICILADMGVDTISLPIATYGVKANIIPIGTDYYSNTTMSLIVALLTNDGNTLRFGTIAGTQVAKPQYLWKNCVWGDAVTIGDANEVIGSGSTESYKHCVQDMTLWNGRLLWGEGHNENRYATLKHTPTESIRESELLQAIPNSNVHAVTEHNGKLFGSGVNFFCMFADDRRSFVYGKTPNEVVNNPIAPEPEEVNYWDLSTRHEATRVEVEGTNTTTSTQVSATASRTIAFDYYIRGATSNGIWRLNGHTGSPTVTIDGNDFTIAIVSSGVGLGVPIDLEVGKTYKLTYTADKGHRVYASYFDGSGVYKTASSIVSSDSAGGTFEKSFTVSDYAYFVLVFRGGVSTIKFTDISIVEA